MRACCASESGDQRLPVFDTDDPDTQTVSIQDGPVTATASAYGEPFAYLPEHRPVMAIDGDPATSWTVGDRGPAVDEYIVLDVSEPIDHVTLRQPDAIDGQRRITEVELTVDDREPTLVALDESSLVGDGQRIDIDPTTASSRITLRITGTGTGTDVSPFGDAIRGVGFATIDVGLEPTTEMIRVPVDATDAMTTAGATTPLSVVLTRLRTDPTDRWRSDPEPALRREFDVPNDAAFDTSVVLRADQRMDDAALAELLGEPVAATAHLTGVPGARGAVRRRRRRGHIVDHAVRLARRAGTAPRPGRHRGLRLDRPARRDVQSDHAGAHLRSGRIDRRRRRPDRRGDRPPPPDRPDRCDAGDHRNRRPLHGRPAVRRGRRAAGRDLGDHLRRHVTGRRTPAGDHVEECRDDLLQVDGAPVGLSFTASADAIVRGEPIDATLCTTEASSVLALDTGTHTI